MDQDAEMIFLYTTFPTRKDAQKVGEELVSEKLAACVNIFSRYGFHLSVGRRHREWKRGGNARQDKKGTRVTSFRSLGGEAPLSAFPLLSRLSRAGWPPPILNGCAVKQFLAMGIQDQNKAASPPN